MEAAKLATLTDLLAHPEERVQLINVEIVRRPMARAEHGLVQSAIVAELSPFFRGAGPGGWWITTEISVLYEVHQCPSHALAGWQRDRLPERPRGVVELTPDWVCEIVSPGHERKDTLTLLLLLQRHRVPYYWLIWPEERTLVAYGLDGVSYRIVANLTAAGPNAAPGAERVAIPPFEAVPIDLSYILVG